MEIVTLLVLHEVVIIFQEDVDERKWTCYSISYALMQQTIRVQLINKCVDIENVSC